MIKQDYADWFDGLSDDERSRVGETLLELRNTCRDPEALVLADAGSEHALVARHLLGMDDDGSLARNSARHAINGLRHNDGHPNARRDNAVQVLMRMRTAGLGEAEILDFAEYIHAFALLEMRQLLDDASISPQFETNPGWAVMELRDGKMTGRLVAAGKNYHPGRYDLDPWPDGVARPRSFPFWRPDRDHPSSET